MKYNDLIPELGVLSYERSIDFYTRTLPFLIEYCRPEKGFAFLSLGGSQLMIEQISGTHEASAQEFREGNWRTAELVHPFGRGISLSILIDSVEEITKRLKDANYPLKMEAKDAWYSRQEILVGQRQILVMDPDGYLLRFQQSLGEKPGD